MNKKFEFNYSVFEQLEDLNDKDKKLLQTAKLTLENAYAPYSHFHVGCAVLLDNEQIVTGVNIENASYPVGICAERSALASAISQFPKHKILAVAISYNSKEIESNTPAFPCGLCRQFMLECEDRNQQNFPVILGGITGEIIKLDTVKNLLPFGFTGSDLI